MIALRFNDKDRMLIRMILGKEKVSFQRMRVLAWRIIFQEHYHLDGENAALAIMTFQTVIKFE